MIRNLITKYITFVSCLRDLPPLIFRLILAFGFYEPAMKKVMHFSDIVQWFGNDLHIPFPFINAVMAVATECSGVVLLTLGLATRFISVPMMGVMVVAVLTVHLPNGFSCGANGYEVPFYYFFMLFSLIVTGAGRFSLDYLLFKPKIK